MALITQLLLVLQLFEAVKIIKYAIHHLEQLLEELKTYSVAVVVDLSAVVILYLLMVDLIQL